MKKILFGLLFCIAFFKSTGQNLPNDKALYKTGHYWERMAVFRGEPITKGKTIFLGNSITEFGDWQKLLSDTNEINRGVAGDNTFGVLARLDDIIARRPGKLFIEMGINDFAQNVAPQQINKIVKGQENLTLETISKLENALGIHIIHEQENYSKVNK